MPFTVTHTAVATAADDPEAEINKAEWNADHTLAGDTITGTAGGAGEAGGSFTIAGGTGDDGNDDPASIVIGGGSGDGSAGVVTVTGALRSDGPEPSTLVLTDRNIEMSGGEAGSGESGGSLTITGGRGNTASEPSSNFSLGGNKDDGTGGDFEAYAGGGETGQPGGYAFLAGGTGDAGNDAPASLTAGGGSGAGSAGVVSVTSAGVTFTLKQAAWVDPGTGNAADIIAALIAAGLMAAS